MEDIKARRLRAGHQLERMAERASWEAKPEKFLFISRCILATLGYGPTARGEGRKG